jgi:hypothetical protein
MLTFKRFQTFQHTILAAVLVAICDGASAKDLISRTKSPAQNARIQYDSKSVAKSFNFFGSTASLDKNGDWSIEGTVTHNGMLCADYEIGLRFGASSAEGDCTDVEWLTMDEYALTQTLCNNATAPYRGVLHDDYLAENFEKISCVERVIRCTGNCK